MNAREWHRWQRRPSFGFYFMWVCAIVTYGAGDFVTTVILVYRYSGYQESNPIVRWILEMYGIPGFLGLKALAFGIGIGVSLHAIGKRNTQLYYFPPVAMVLMGVVATGIHLELIL